MFIFVLLAALLYIFYVFGSLLIGNQSDGNGCRLPPGPWGLPVLGHLHLLGDLPHRNLHKLANKFGHIMYIRLGIVPTVVVSSPETAELVLKTHDVIFASRPKLQAAEYMSYGQKGLVFAEYGSRWRNIRKLCTSQLLSTSKIESMKSTRMEEVRSLVRWLRDAAEAGAVVDLTAKVGSLIEDMTLGMIVGHGKANRFRFKSSIEEIMKLSGAFNIADFIPFVGLFDPQGLCKRMKAVSQVVDGILEDIVDDHIRERGTEKYHHRDFIDVILSLSESNGMQEELDRDAIKAVILDMIAGAMDTSSTAIEWALSEIFKNPRVMRQLQKELGNVVGKDRMVGESDFVKLDYLDLVVKESMRLHPVAPLLWHQSVEGITINGYYIPKNTRIIVNTWAIGQDPKVWSENVNEFFPERFIHTNMDFRGSELRFIPFGLGRRGCPGIQLGVTIVRLVVAQLVHCFNWDLPNEMAPKDLDMHENFGLTLPRASHLHAKPTYRLENHKL